MNFVNLKREIFTVTYAGVTYSKEFYTPAISVTGVENETHSNWNATATYAEGAYVIVPELKSIYKSGLNNNTGIFPPSDSTSWTWWGFVNSMNMFTCDENLGSQTVGTNVVVTIPFNQSNVLAILDTNFSTVNIKQIDNNTNKEIKNIVENATSKANQGKKIASNMIEGYKELNQNITNTINLISDIEMSSKEQLSGIEQINDAVNQLDQQTQQNAAIASQTHDVAVITDEIAKIVVTSANAKEFKGKDSVLAKDININSNASHNVKPNQVSHKKVEHKVIANNKSTDDNEWESF